MESGVVDDHTNVIILIVNLGLRTCPRSYLTVPCVKPADGVPLTPFGRMSNQRADRGSSKEGLYEIHPTGRAPKWDH